MTVAQPEEVRLRVVRAIRDRCPEQLKLPFALWTRESVGELVEKRFEIVLSPWMVGRYLKRWGFTPQKPVRRADERCPKTVKKWLDGESPKIKAQAKTQGAEIHWGDQRGLRSDHQTGTTDGLKGRIPVIPGTGKRFRCHMMSSITNPGKLAFMVFTHGFTAAVMIEFLSRLIRLSKTPVFLIVDGHPVHRSKTVQAWLSQHSTQIQMFRLPAYSPELNPNELLNQGIKSNALGRRRPTSQSELIEDVRSHLRSTSVATPHRPKLLPGRTRRLCRIGVCSCAPGNVSVSSMTVIVFALPPHALDLLGN